MSNVVQPLLRPSATNEDDRSLVARSCDDKLRILRFRGKTLHILCLRKHWPFKPKNMYSSWKTFYILFFSVCVQPVNISSLHFIIRSEA